MGQLIFAFWHRRLCIHYQQGVLPGVLLTRTGLWLQSVCTAIQELAWCMRNVPVVERAQWVVLLSVRVNGSTQSVHTLRTVLTRKWQHSVRTHPRDSAHLLCAPVQGGSLIITVPLLLWHFNRCCRPAGMCHTCSTIMPSFMPMQRNAERTCEAKPVLANALMPAW